MANFHNFYRDSSWSHDLCKTSIVADATRMNVRMLDSLRHKFLVLKTGDKVGQSPACHG